MTDPVPPVEEPTVRPRPTGVSEEQLGFRRLPAVRWLAPRVLVTTGAQALVAAIFGSFADKRELQAGLPPVVHRYGDAGELWWDYVADLGDGFDATYSVASLLAADFLEPDGAESLPRGRLLIMGGDEVYPAASTQAYEERSKGVYRAALPVSKSAAPTLLALPGNHDWYDGLTAFLRVFAQRRPFGGWKTEQTRSYFAAELPGGWWLFAIDTQLTDYLDAPQLQYFRTVSEQLRRGDAVILCTSTPAWVPAGSGGETKGYDTFDFFNRHIVAPHGATIRVMLSGDKHHYARYAEHGGTSQRITCGTGGAYLSATHELPDQLTLPSVSPGPSELTQFDLTATYPDQARSQRLAPGIFRLPWRNWSFWGLTGTLQTLMTLAVLLGVAGTGAGIFRLLAAWAPSAILAAVLVLGGIAFARFNRPANAKNNIIAGVLHAVAHLALSVGWTFVVLWLAHDVLPHSTGGDLLTFVIVVIATPGVIGFLDAEIVAAYLLLASRYGINLNEAFAGQSIEDYKGFLRLHIDTDGTLTVYPIKLRAVCHNWRADPDGAPSDPWLRPDGMDLVPELIEDPITIPHTAG